MLAGVALMVADGEMLCHCPISEHHCHTSKHSME